MKHKLTRITALMLAVIMSFSMLLVPVQAASFTDVPEKAWYKAAVDYVSEKGWMNGVGEMTFAPTMDVTRAMFVTVLARLVGGETDNDAAIFTDTAEGKWYTGPASWATLNGIVKGIGDGRFAPNRAITRQDLCVMLYKYLHVAGIKLKADADRTYADFAGVSAYAKEAVAFCAASGLVTGFEDGTFRPKNTATRAQVAQILMRLDQLRQGEELPEDPMPAQSFDGAAGEDMSVSVNAPVGALPENTDMTVSRVTDEAYLAALSKQAGVKIVAAADISFTKDGAELEPEKNVEVQFSLDGMEELDNPTVLHVRQDGVLEYVSSEMISTTRGGAKALRFYAKDFSVYIIGSGSTVELFTVTFYEPDGNGGWQIINKQSIRKDQIASGALENPVFDPGVPSLSETDAFEGWAETSTITGDTVGKTVADVNAYVKANYATIGVDDDTHNNGLKYYAIVREVAFISFRDQDGVVFRTVSVPLTGGVGSYTLDLSYTPYSSSWAHLGWITAISNTGEEPTYPDDAVIYENGDIITLSQNIDLYPYLKQGHWVVFDNYIGQDDDSTSASYTQPLYFANEEVTVEPTDYGDSNYDGVDHDTAPYREGYTFQGWYSCTKDAEGNITGFGSLYDWGHTITEDVTVAAKWSPRTDTPYTVIIWTQRASDAAGLDDEDKTYDFYKSIETRKGATNSVANFTTADTQLAGSGNELGFYYTYNSAKSDTAGVKIKGDGSTVVNVKYDRREVTVNFHGSLSSYTYDSSSGYWNINYAHYGRVGGKYVYLKLASTSSSYPDSDGDIRTSNARWTVATTGETYTGTIYRVSASTSSSSTFLTYKGLYGSTLVGWPGSDPGYRWAYTNTREYGMTIPIDAYIPWYETITWDIYRQNPDSTNSRTQYYYGQDENGRYPTSEDEYMAVGHVYWAAGGSSTLYLNDTLFLGYKKDYWRNGSFTASNTDISHDSGNTQISGSSMSTNGIYIFYKRNQWNLTFFSNGEELTDLNATVYYNHKLSDYKPTADPTNGPVGYYFDGWYKDPNGEEPFDWSDNMPNNNLAVYAKWSKIRYRVIFDVTGGDPTAEVELPEGQATAFRVWYGEKVLSGALNQATRDGYILVGWYYDQAHNQPFNFDTAIVEETPTLDKTYSNNLTDTTVRTGYDPYAEEGKKNWDDTTEDCWNVRSKLTIYALWRVNPIGSDGVRVRYDAVKDEGYFAPKTDPRVIYRDDPNIYTDKAKAFAQPASTPENEEEYQFLYWVVMQPVKDGNGNPVLDENGEPVLEETTIKVYPGQTFDVGYEYTVRTEAYKITWVYNAPNGTEKRETVTVTAGAMPNRTDPSGYVSNGQFFPFDHWSPEIVAATENTTYTAVYGEGQALTQTFTVTWKNWDGSTLATQTYTVGDMPSYTGATPTRPDDENYTYTFSGWTPEITVVAENATYTAAFAQAPKPFNVVFNANGGSISGNSTTTVSGVTKGTVFRDIFPDDPTRSNYNFYGWFTAANGGTKVEETDEFDGSFTTLYAHWATTSWNSVSSLEADNLYIFVHESYAMTYNGAGSNLTRASYSASSLNTKQVWYTVEDTSHSGYFYLDNYYAAVTDGADAYVYTNSYSTALSANTQNGLSFKFESSQLKYDSSYSIYYSSGSYSSGSYKLSNSNYTTFTAYKYVVTDTNAGSKGGNGAGELGEGIGLTHIDAAAPARTALSKTEPEQTVPAGASVEEPAAAPVAPTEKPAAAPVARTDNPDASVASVLDPVVTEDPAAGMKLVRMREHFASNSITTAGGTANISGNTGWIAYNAGRGNNWTTYTFSSGTNYACDGYYAAQYTYNSANAANCYLISPPIAVSANATALEVSLQELVYSSRYAETFEVFFVKADGFTTPASLIGSTQYPAISSASYTNTSYAKVSGSVSNVSALAGQSVRVVVHCTSADNMYNLYVDDIIVRETATEEAVTYEPVSYPDEFSAGEDYIMAIGNYAVANSAVENNRYVEAQYVTVNGDGTITLPANKESALLWHIGGSSSAGWTFYNAAANQYLGLNANDDYWLTMMTTSWSWLYDGTNLDNQCTESGNANSSNTGYYRYLSYSTAYDDFTTSIGTGDTTHVIFYRPVDNTPKHTVTWRYRDDSGAWTQTTSQVREGDLPEAPDTIPTAYTSGGVTYALTGWDPALASPTDDDDLYTAQYTPSAYTITWVYTDASGSHSQTTVVSVGETPVPPLSPADYTVAGTTKTFDHWDPSLTAPTANTTYTAIYRDKSYTITWNYKTVAGADTSRTTEVAPGEVPVPGFTPPDYTYDGDDYRFSNWNSQADGSGTPPVAATGPATYTARYTSTTFNITWHYRNADGTWNSVVTKVAEGAVPNHNTHPMWTDSNEDEWMFSSWNSQEDGSGTAPVAATANADYWAQYSKVGVYTYTMYLYAVYGRANTTGLSHIFWYANNGTADNNGGGVRQEDLDLPINENTTIPTPSSFTYTVASRDTQQHGLTYVGHTFLGWARVRNTDDNDGIAHPEFNSVDDCWLIWHDNGDGTGYYTVNPDNNDEASDVAIDPTTQVATVAADEMRPYHDLYAVWESHVFYVYHSSSGVLQAFDMPLNKTAGAAAGSMIGDFDITKLVSDNHLYGGYYKTYGGVNMTELQKLTKTVGCSTWSEGSLISENWKQVGEIQTADNTGVSFEKYDGKSLTSSKHDNAKFWTKGDAYNAENRTGLPESFTAADVNGTTMKPVADTIYYLKEVPNAYLHSYYTYVLRFNEDGEHPANPTEQQTVSLDELYLFTVVDDNNYKTTGMRTGTDYAAANALTEVTARTAIAPAFTLTQSGNANHTPINTKITPNNLIQQRGYISVNHPTPLPTGTFTMIPSWKTLDGVTVGNVPLELTVGEKTVTNQAVTIPAVEKDNKVYIDCGAVSMWLKDNAVVKVECYPIAEGDSNGFVTVNRIAGTNYFWFAKPEGSEGFKIFRYAPNGTDFWNKSVYISYQDQNNFVSSFNYVGLQLGENEWIQDNNSWYDNNGVTWKTYIP